MGVVLLGYLREFVYIYVGACGRGMYYAEGEFFAKVLKVLRRQAFSDRL